MPDYTTQDILEQLQPKQRGFGRLSVDLNRIPTLFKNIANTATAPISAFGELAKHANTPPSQMDNEDIKNMLMSGPGAMLPGFGRALGGTLPAAELGISGSRLLARPDVIKYASELRSQGKTYKEVTDALRERYAPIIDSNAPLSQRMVLVRGQRTNDTFNSDLANKRNIGKGTFELGAMGGSGKTPTQGPNFTTEDVVNLLKENGGVIKDIKNSNSSASQYINWHPEGNPPKEGMGTPQIRISDPNDIHAGRTPMSNVQRLNYIDTSGDRLNKTNATARKNASGEPYTDLDTLKDAINWRTLHELVPPGKEPWSMRQKVSPPEGLENSLSTDPNQQNMMDTLLALDPRQRPDSIVGGASDNLFSSAKLQERNNLVSPQDLNMPFNPGIQPRANFDPPKLPFEQPQHQMRFDQKYFDLLESLKSMKEPPNGP